MAGGGFPAVVAGKVVSPMLPGCRHQKSRSVPGSTPWSMREATRPTPLWRNILVTRPGPSNIGKSHSFSRPLLRRHVGGGSPLIRGPQIE
jgi:hypothetical protein